MVSQIELLQASKVSTLLELKTKDETIKWLQQEVKDNKDKIKNGGSISVIGTQISFTGSNGTIITFDASSPVKSGDTLKLYPVYSSSSKDTTWVKYNVKANKDSIVIDLSVKNKYSVVIGEVKGEKWYSKRKPVVEVTNQNPYDKIKSLRTFEVKDTRKSRLSIGVGVGVGVTPKGILPSINLGLNYALFKL